MIKLTKTELRSQQERLGQLNRYLPTLQLKKMLLQAEVSGAEQELEGLRELFKKEHSRVELLSPLFSDPLAFDLFPCLKVEEVKKHFENIAGVDIPVFEGVIFQDTGYLLFDSPVWVDSAIQAFQQLIEVQEKVAIGEEKLRLLEKELRDVSIRVNLFEKILIPRSQSNIKKIKIFLGDQQLTAVCQAKVSKIKIMKKQELKQSFQAVQS